MVRKEGKEKVRVVQTGVPKVDEPKRGLGNGPDSLESRFYKKEGRGRC